MAELPVELILLLFGTILASAAHLILRDHTDMQRRRERKELV